MQFTRRQLGALAAGLTGSCLTQAHAGIPRGGLVLTCIDCRTPAPPGLHVGRAGLAVAGASLAPVTADFAESSKAFWGHVRIARTLHHGGKLIVIDHEDCDAYRLVFGRTGAEQHKAVMARLKAALEDEKAGLEAEFYLLDEAERLERLL